MLQSLHLWAQYCSSTYSVCGVSTSTVQSVCKVAWRDALTLGYLHTCNFTQNEFLVNVPVQHCRDDQWMWDGTDTWRGCNSSSNLYVIRSVVYIDCVAAALRNNYSGRKMWKPVKRLSVVCWLPGFVENSAVTRSSMRFINRHDCCCCCCCCCCALFSRWIDHSPINTACHGDSHYNYRRPRHIDFSTNSFPYTHTVSQHKFYSHKRNSRDCADIRRECTTVSVTHTSGLIIGVARETVQPAARTQSKFCQFASW